MRGFSASRLVADVRPGEGLLAFLMSAYFFLVITSFWILKPLKKTLLIGLYSDEPFRLLGHDLGGPEAEQVAKVLNMLVAALAMTVFSALANRHRRQHLSYIFTTFFILAYGYFAIALQSPAPPAVWCFYLLGDLFSTLMVATFFAFLNDSVSPDAAKRLFGIIGFGGVAGGVFGASIVASFISSAAISQWLLVTGSIAALILLIAWAAGRRVDARRDPGAGGTEKDAATASSSAAASSSASPEKPPMTGSPALAGARLAARSPYLLAIVSVVAIYEIVSTIVDYQFTKGVVHFVTDEAAQRQHFALVFAITNWTSMLVQLFLTSFVMRRFGLVVALMILPISIFSASGAFLVFPTLWIASLLNTADNGFSYSINQSAKEALYVPTTAQEKYQAKAFIDMFIQRFAKTLAVGVSLTAATLFTSFQAARILTLVLIPLLIAWAFAARYAGRHFAELEAPSSPSPPATSPASSPAT
jgi:AAA family ATP:ADP antiporter